MITVESLTRKYGGFTAVDDVTFTARPGRVTGFLGPNGAGKSTTMRIMVGLTPATSGSALIDGARFADLTNPGPRGRRPPRRLGPARRAHRPRDPHHRAAHDGAAQGARRRDARPGQPHARGGGPQGPQLLPRHAAAARHRGGAHRRPARADPRRAGQRPRPGRHPLDARPAARLRHRWRHRAAVLAPAPRDRGHRRRHRRHRSRAGSSPRAPRPSCSPAPAPSSAPREAEALGRALVAAGASCSAVDGGLRTDATPDLVGRVALGAGVPLTELRAGDGAGLEDMFLELTSDTQREGAAA